ncbi:MAG: type II toxin-antitoxin system Phd/YefM family antitoxin [Egibacteraceae bacterium]
MSAEPQPSQYNIHEAKTNLSRLVERVESGEEIIISRAGKPAARLVPLKPVARPVRGLWRGRVVIHDDFDELPEEILDAFEGRER